MRIFAILLVLVTLTRVNCKSRDGPNRHVLVEMFSWDAPDFEIPPDRREQAITSGSYVPNKNGIHSLAIWRDKMFVGINRITRGVASSLNYFSINSTNKSPVLIPYPSFEANYVNEDPDNRTISLPSQASVINVAHFEIDKCNRLWAADAGYTEIFGDTRPIAPPAIVIFNLTTNTFILRREISAKYLDRLSILPEIVIDYTGDNCEDVHAYISDGFGSIIVYSLKKDRMWQVVHNSMTPDPREAHFEFQHLEFVWNYGVFALAVGDQQSDGSKRVYYAPLSSTKVFYVPNRVLQDENYDVSKYNDEFHLLGETGRDGHTNTLVYDEKTGVVLNTMFGGATIGCWNALLPYQSMRTLHKTGSSGEFYPTDLDIDDYGNVWAVSHLAPMTAYEELPVGIKNLRIYKTPIEKAIEGTNCKRRKSKD